MPLPAYSETNLLLTWHVKNDDSVLTDEVKKRFSVICKANR